MSGSGRRGQCLAAIVVIIVADIDGACGRGKVDVGRWTRDRWESPGVTVRDTSKW
jgi:hypothetical protein